MKHKSSKTGRFAVCAKRDLNLLVAIRGQSVQNKPVPVEQTEICCIDFSLFSQIMLNVENQYILKFML